MWLCDFINKVINQASFLLVTEIPWDSMARLFEKKKTDIEWAHAMAPNKHIIMVEAPSDNFAGKMYAVSYA